MKIENINAREILDSRGFPTVECCVTLENGTQGCASVPSGASTGSHEAVELRDKDKHRYEGQGVLKAVRHIQHIIGPELKGCEVGQQQEIDERMINLDGSNNKSQLGANAILATSLAVAHTAARAYGLPLYRYLGGINAFRIPIPMLNLINGGRHSDAPIAFQEFMIRPIGAYCIKEALRYANAVFMQLKKILHRRNLSTAVGDEGGFAPMLDGVEDALSCLTEAIKNAGFKPGKDITLALDCAATEFYHRGTYDYTHFEGSNGKKLSSSEQVAYLKQLVDTYPIDSIEDGMSEDDWKGWKLLTETLGKRIQLVGDDLFVTQKERLKKGIRERCANAILIKPNQVGTLSETLQTIHIAQEHGYRVILSHRSGETIDTTIADIAVATNAGQIKAGSVTRSERSAKYNRLFAIQDSLGKQRIYGYKDNNSMEDDSWFNL